MAGIYIHIPFCRKACTYCDFHFSTNLALKEKLLETLLLELEQRKDFLKTSTLKSIYFGGGTPSVLTPGEIEKILVRIQGFYSLSADVEITLEANPDDLNLNYLKAIRKVGVNRLSIGVQSFEAHRLEAMNRSHNAAQALKCIHEAREAGFENFSIDLIYGQPQQSLTDWEKDLEQAIALKVPHLSCYALTVEEKTVLAHQVKKGKVHPAGDAVVLDHFNLLQKRADAAGYAHYEISNLALAGKQAVHNSSYWAGEAYLGLGPSAHSFDGENLRKWNVANNHAYIKGVQEGEVYFEEERLSVADAYNEAVMTGLRLQQGVNISAFSADLKNYVMTESEILRKQGKLILENNRLYIPEMYRFQADGIAADLFYI